MIIDTHIHLDLNKFDKDLDETIKRAKDKGVDKFIIPGIESTKMNKIIKIVEKYKDVYFSTGNHPNHLDSFNIKEIEKHISHEKCVAVGECGLDWYRIPNGTNINDIKKQQIEIFEEHIKLSNKYKKPLILHSRDTDEDMFNTLIKYKDELVGGVIHCYIGSLKLLELEKYNFYYGIGGIVTYPSALDLRNNLKRVPFHKLLLETDGPFLTPKQKKGFRNEPSYIPYIVDEMSKLLHIDKNILENKIYKNTERLFKFN